MGVNITMIAVPDTLLHIIIALWAINTILSLVSMALKHWLYCLKKDTPDEH